MNELTDRQREIYDFIIKYHNDNGYSPTIREIGAGCYLKSNNSVLRHLGILIKKGYILYEPNICRSIRVKTPIK